jgi:hypothetical protein
MPFCSRTRCVRLRREQVLLASCCSAGPADACMRLPIRSGRGTTCAKACMHVGVGLSGCRRPLWTCRVGGAREPVHNLSTLSPVQVPNLHFRHTLCPVQVPDVHSGHTKLNDTYSSPAHGREQGCVAAEVSVQEACIILRACMICPCVHQASFECYNMPETLPCVENLMHLPPMPPLFAGSMDAALARCTCARFDWQCVKDSRTLIPPPLGVIRQLFAAALACARVSASQQQSVSSVLAPQAAATMDGSPTPAPSSSTRLGRAAGALVRCSCSSQSTRSRLAGHTCSDYEGEDTCMPSYRLPRRVFGIDRLPLALPTVTGLTTGNPPDRRTARMPIHLDIASAHLAANFCKWCG